MATDAWKGSCTINVHGIVCNSHYGREDILFVMIQFILVVGGIVDIASRE